jgi:hypothetical protein
LRARAAGGPADSAVGGIRRLAQVEPLAHFLARLEIGDALGVDVDRLAGARVAALAGVALAGRKGAEAAQLDAAALLKLVDDRVEEGARRRARSPCR